MRGSVPRAVLWPILSAAIILFGSQGCSLLFVQKGSTRFSSKAPEPLPTAVSLVSRSSGPETMEYTVGAGDTLETIAQALYGDSRSAGHLAKANRLKVGGPLKVGRVLKVPPAPTSAKSARPKPTPTMDMGSAGLPREAPSPVLKKVIKRSEGASYEIEVSDAKKPKRPRVNRAFAPGEYLKFEVRYFSVVGGIATLAVEALEDFNGRPCYRLAAEARSAFPFSKFFAVQDRMVSHFDAVDFFPWQFDKNVREGGYREKTRTEYRQMAHKAVRHKNQDPPNEIPVAPYVQDVLSTFYYFRLLPAEVGERLAIPTQADTKNYELVVEVIRREKIRVKAGTFNCLLLRPHSKYDNVFQNKGDILLWVTDDERRMPVLIRTKVVIGAIDIELLEARLPRLPEPTKP